MTDHTPTPRKRDFETMYYEQQAQYTEERGMLAQERDGYKARLADMCREYEVLAGQLAEAQRAIAKGTLAEPDEDGAIRETWEVQGTRFTVTLGAKYLSVLASTPERIVMRDRIKLLRDEHAEYAGARLEWMSKLLAALNYWMPDETLVKPEEEAAWDKDIKLCQSVAAILDHPALSKKPANDHGLNAPRTCQHGRTYAEHCELCSPAAGNAALTGDRIPEGWKLVPVNPLDEVLFEMATAIKEEVEYKAPAPDMDVLRERYMAAWHRVLAKVKGVSVPRVVQCLWTRDPEHESGVFKTECGRMVCSEDEPEDWEATYCQYCGKPFKFDNAAPEEGR